MGFSLGYETRKDQTGTASLGKTLEIKLRDFLLAPNSSKYLKILPQWAVEAIRYLSETLPNCLGLDSRLEISTGKKYPF